MSLKASKTADQYTIDTCTVFGYIRESQTLWSSMTNHNNSYYNIPSGIAILCLEYYYETLPLKVGYRVKLEYGKTGVIRYIGFPDFADEELIGIELDVWSANAGNGSVRGHIMFHTSSGRGHFTQRKSITEIITSRIREGAYARLKGLQRVPRFNGKTVKIVSFLEKKGRWRVKLLHAKQEKKYLRVREENLDPILDWEPLNDESEKEGGLHTEPQIGDRVKTRKGMYGKVKYVGPVEFQFELYGNGNQIGLELEKWDPNGHDGTVSGKSYFTVQSAKRGYFIKLQNLMQNLGNQENIPIKQPL